MAQACSSHYSRLPWCPWYWVVFCSYIFSRNLQSLIWSHPQDDWCHSRYFGLLSIFILGTSAVWWLIKILPLVQPSVLVGGWALLTTTEMPWCFDSMMIKPRNSLLIALSVSTTCPAGSSFCNCPCLLQLPLFVTWHPMEGRCALAQKTEPSWLTSGIPHFATNLVGSLLVATLYKWHLEPWKQCPPWFGL